MGGKSSQQQSKVQIPKALQDAAKANLGLAGDVGALPYMPNFAPQVAAITPQQTAAMQGTNSAASAFGLPQSKARNFGMPATTNVGGFSGYSTQPLYNAAKAGLTPAQRKMLASFTYNPRTGAPPTNPNMKTSGSKPAPAPAPAPAPRGGGMMAPMLAGTPIVNKNIFNQKTPMPGTDMFSQLLGM